jgi:hypothetical protein
MRNITDVKIIVEDNCFENTGNRQRELGRPGIFPGGVIPGTNNSYYGGTVIYGGGLRNPAIQDAGITSASTGVILDLGNGELGSLGHNNFIDVSGPDVWIETGSFLSAERNWFAGGAPVAAGGGFVDFQPQLKSGPRTCHENDSSSSD